MNKSKSILNIANYLQWQHKIHEGITEWNNGEIQEVKLIDPHLFYQMAITYKSGLTYFYKYDPESYICFFADNKQTAKARLKHFTDNEELIDRIINS